MDESMTEEEDKILAWAEKYASRSGLRINPDKEQAKLIAQGLAKNQQKHGRRYCPCRVVTGKPEEDKKIICPCAYHKDETATQGSCHCGLFVK